MRAPVLQTGGRRFESSTAHLVGSVIIKIDGEAVEFIKEKGGKVWVKGVCISGCCGLEGFEPQFSFKEENGEWVEYDYDGIKVYLHPSILRFRKLVIGLQKVFGFKGLMGYVA